MFTIQGNMTYKVICDTYKVTLTIGYILIWVYMQGNIHMTYKVQFLIHEMLQWHDVQNTTNNVDCRISNSEWNGG